MKRYTFNGEGYRSEEEANAARDSYIQKQHAEAMQRAYAQNADMASVGYDQNRYNMLMASGNGLSQMTTAESDFIKNRWQPDATTKYKNSATDQYLASIGLPPSSELNKYRTKYTEYNATGSLQDNYSGVDDRAWNKIKELWAKDWQYGQTDEDMRRRASGLAPESYDSMYTDTLLDDQLKAAGLPPSKLMNGKLGEAYNEWIVNDNKYRSIYDQIAKENAKHIRDNDGTSFEDVVMSVLSSPDNLDFVNAHYGELEDMPVLESDAYKLTEKKNGVTIDVKDSEGNQLYDEAKWRKDYIKASTKNAAISGDDFGITFDSIQKYWDENAVYYNAELAAEDYFKRSGVIPSEDQFMEKLGDFATAQSINDGAGFTVQNIFGDDIPEDKLETYQPFVTKLNQLLTEEGYSAAYNYLTGGEFASDMRAVQEEQWIANYKTEFADVPEALNKTDDEILDIYYGKFSTTYGMDESQIKAVRNGDLTVNGYMTDKVKTAADARQFAQDRRTRELEAAGLPTTREELEAEKKRLYDERMKAAAGAIDDHGFAPSVSKEEYDKIDRQYMDIDGALKHWYDLETEYFIDAMSYTQDFKDKTANMDDVNRQFYKIVAETHNAITDKQAENLVKHATDEEKRQLVYLYNTPEYTNQYEPDGNTGRNIAVYKRQDFLNNVLMRRWDSIEKGEQIAAQRNGGFGWDDVLNAALTGGLSALSAINMGENSSAFGRTMRGIGGTLAAVTTQPFEAVANLLSDSVSMIAGKDIYASQRTSTWADNEISIIANRISSDHGERWAQAYQLMPSMIQSTGGAVLSYFTGGASEALTLALMSAQAYSSTVENALLNGASTKEAFWFGIASGAAEAFFEKFSLEALTEGMKGIGDVVKEFGGAGRKKLAVEIGKFLLSRMPISGSTEASEELFTSAANDLAERLILTYDSSQEKLRRHYLDAGLSAEEADKRVMDDCLKALAFDAAAGFASGALMSFGSNLVAAGTSIRQDGIRINDFVNTAQNLSGISYDDAIALAKEYAQTDTSNNLTLDGARSVVEALRARGADSTTIARVANELTDKNTQNDVMTYLNNQVAQQQLDDKIKLVTAAEKVLTRSNAMNLGAEAISAYVSQYANEMLEAAQKGSSENLEKIMRQMQRGFIDETVRRSGAYHAAGATAITDYIASLDEQSAQLVTEQAKKFVAKFSDESTGLDAESADSYALYAAAMMHLTGSKVQGADFVRASTFLFGKSASSIPLAIQNACLNSDGKAAKAFVDAALTAVAMHEDSDASMLMNQLSTGMSPAQFAVSSLALASQRAVGSYQRSVYDYIMRNGVTESTLNLLAATLRYEAMNGNARAAAEKVYASNRSDAVMTSDQSSALADEHAKLLQQYNAARENYELRQQRNDTSLVNANSVVVRYTTEYDAFFTDSIEMGDGEVVRSIPTESAEAAERVNDALKRAIEARDKLAVENDGKLQDSKNDLDAKKEKLDKFEVEYSKKLNRQTVAFVKHMEQFLIAMSSKDAPTRAAIDRETALFVHGTAENLNDIERKMIAAEKTKAVALGDALGVKVEVAAFDDDYCEAHGFGDAKAERGFEQGGKVYLNELMAMNTKTAQNRGTKSITGYYTDYVLVHEFGHIAEKSTGKYNKYYQFAMDYMRQEYGDYIDKWIDKVAQRKGYTKQKAEREVVAEFTRTALLTDPRAIKALCDKAPVMATRIYQWLNKVGGNLFNDSVAQSATIAKAQRAYARALKASVAEYKKMPNQSSVTQFKEASKDANDLAAVAQEKPQKAIEPEPVVAVQEQTQEEDFFPPEGYRFDEAYTESDARSYNDDYLADTEDQPAEQSEDNDFETPDGYRFDEAYMENDARSFSDEEKREYESAADETASAFTELNPIKIAERYSVEEINSEYMPLAQKYLDRQVTRDELKKLRAMVEAVAIKRGVITTEKGRPLNLYRGTTFFDNSGNDISLSGNTIFTTTDMAVASGYSHNRFDGDDPHVRQLRAEYVEDDGTDETLIQNAKNILNMRVGVNSDGFYYDKVTGEPFTREELQDAIEKYKDRGIYHMYGFAGDNQYRIDAKGAHWTEIDNSEYGEDTDEIAENARFKHTSARIDNVLDGSISYDAGTENQADDLIFYRTNDLKSGDIVTVDSDRNIIPLTERFNNSKPNIKYFSEIGSEIKGMSDAEYTAYGSPHMFVSSNGLMVRRLVSSDGYFSGNVTSGGERKIAMIAPADKFMSNGTPVLRMPLAADSCYAVVVPSSLAYADCQTDARERGLNVVTYDEDAPTQFDAAQVRAVETDSPSFFLDDDLTYEGFLKEFGQMSAGENPRVDRAVPRRTSKNNRVSRAYRNIMESPYTTEETAEKMRSWLVRNGIGAYVPQSNTRSIAKAQADLRNYGSVKAAAAALHGNVASDTGKNTDLVALGEVLLAQMQGDETLTDEERAGIVSDLCILATDSGRASQLFSVIKRMTPDGHIVYMDQVGKRIASRFEKRTKKPIDLSLTEEEKARYKNAITQEERDLIDEDVTRRFGQATSELTWREKMRNWRYFAMLANARTHVRNIMGNTLMVPIMRMKDAVNTFYQGIDVRRSSESHPTLSQSDRTTTYVPTRVDAQTRDFVEKQLDAALPIMQGVSAKYIESASKNIKNGVEDKSLRARLTADVQSAHLFNGKTRSPFLNRISRGFNKVSSINSNALEIEDALFLGLRFKSSMYQQIAAQELNVNDMTPEQAAKIANYAMEQALISTFRDASALADAINEFERNSKVGVLTEGLLPFKKTPINIAKRSIELSPLGLLQGAYKMISNNASYKKQLENINASNISDGQKQVRINQLEQSYIKERIAAIDRLASGTTGSLLTGLGILAASLGWISVKRKDDEADTFENGLGKSRYSLNIGNTSIDLSAFSPAAVPLIIGATIFEMADGKSDTDGTPLFSAIIGSLCETIDPITEMSVISSFADAMGFSSYSNEEAQNTRTIFSFLGKGLSSYVGQYVPTVVSQIERTFDPYSRSYSAGDDYWASRVFGSDVGTFAKNMQNKVGLGWLAEPKMNVHGEEVTNYTNFGSWVWNALNQTILPASWKADNKNEIDYELVRLYGTVGDTGLFPTKPSRNVGSYTDSETHKSVPLKLTNDTEYMEYQRDYGQAVYDALDELLASPEYEQMTDDERALAIENAIDNAKKAIRNVWKAKMIERNSK